MKRKLALLLAAVMLFSSLLCVFTSADGDSATTVAKPDKPAITYANVNYTSELVLMFAVPVPSSLPEGATVSLILWDDPLAILSCGYKDVEGAVAIELSPRATTATIDNVEHYVFEYDGLSAEMMTDVIYARPVISLSDGTHVYGDMINYSIVEYTMGAKGKIDGIAPITDGDVLGLLDKMLNFGAMVQTYLGDDGAYLPNGYYANDELAKLMIIPSYDGKAGDAVLGGFFKKGEQTYATLNPIYDDYYVFEGWYDAEGNEIADADDDEYNGVQVEISSESDVTVTIKLKRKSLMTTDVNSHENFKFTSLEINKNDTQKNKGDFSFNPSYSYTGKPNAVEAYQRENAHHAFEIMDDPYNPGEKVYKWTASTLSAIYFSPTSGATLPMSSGISGFGDTVDTAITIEIEIGRNENGEIMKTGIFRIRSDYEGQINFAIFAVREDGDVVIPTNNDVAGKSGIVIGSVPESGYGKFAFTVDFNDGTIKGFSESESGDMVLGGESVMYNATYEKYFAAGVSGYTSFRDWSLNAQKKFEWFGEKNALTATELAELADLDGDGIGETPLKTDGVINEQALAYLTEKHNSMLIKSVGIFAGIMYE